MKRPIAALALTALVALTSAGAALAHHSFAMYDGTKVVTLKGAVKSFQWTNPHVIVWLMGAPTTGGAPQVWTVELTSPGNLTRIGWTRKSLNAGDEVEVQINPLRDGQPGGSFKTAKLLATGQVLTANWVPPGASKP
jgi:hypothetical protein